MTTREEPPAIVDMPEIIRVNNSKNAASANHILANGYMHSFFESEYNISFSCDSPSNACDEFELLQQEIAEFVRTNPELLALQAKPASEWTRAVKEEQEEIIVVEAHRLIDSVPLFADYRTGGGWGTRELSELTMAGEFDCEHFSYLLSTITQTGENAFFEDIEPEGWKQKTEYYTMIGVVQFSRHNERSIFSDIGSTHQWVVSSITNAVIEGTHSGANPYSRNQVTGHDFNHTLAGYPAMVMNSQGDYQHYMTALMGSASNIELAEYTIENIDTPKGKLQTLYESLPWSIPKATIADVPDLYGGESSEVARNKVFLSNFARETFADAEKILYLNDELHLGLTDEQVLAMHDYVMRPNFTHIGEDSPLSEEYIARIYIAKENFGNYYSVPVFEQAIREASQDGVLSKGELQEIIDDLSPYFFDNDKRGIVLAHIKDGTLIRTNGLAGEEFAVSIEIEENPHTEDDKVIITASTFGKDRKQDASFSVALDGFDYEIEDVSIIEAVQSAPPRPAGKPVSPDRQR